MRLRLPATSRVTRLGRLLRLAKLDELPQLWNILAGEMSFVGPRPLVESTVNRFRDDYRWILSESRPGVTDPASIKYRHESAILGACSEPLDYYFRVIMPDKIRMQKAYLRRQSALGDVSDPVPDAGRLLPLQRAFQPQKTTLQPRNSSRTRLVGVGLRPMEESALPEFPVYFTTEQAESRSWEMDALASCFESTRATLGEPFLRFTLAAKDSSPLAEQPEVPQPLHCIEPAM